MCKVSAEATRSLICFPFTSICFASSVRYRLVSPAPDAMKGYAAMANQQYRDLLRALHNGTRVSPVACTETSLQAIHDQFRLNTRALGYSTSDGTVKSSNFRKRRVHEAHVLHRKAAR